MGEFKIRDTNDEINKLLHEKSNWEDQIIALGGPDYKKLGPKLLDKEGKEAPGSRGYKYFGAAKDLPGVKELFEQEIAPTRKNRAELMRQIDADYYGYLDDEDYMLVKQEEKCEKEARKFKIEELRNKIDEKMETDEIEPSDDDDEEKENPDKLITSEDEEEKIQSIYQENTKRLHRIKKSHIPSMKEVEEAILEQKKKTLLSIYVSEELQQSETEVKQLSGTIL